MPTFSHAMRLATLSLYLASGYAGTKLKVAVLNFVDGAGGSTQSGETVTELLITRLVNGGLYEIVERATLQEILAEQAFSNSDRSDAATAALIGKISGVNAFVTGRLLRSEVDNSGRPSALFMVSARLVDVSTAKVLIAVEGIGKTQDSSAQHSSMNELLAVARERAVDQIVAKFEASINAESRASAHVHGACNATLIPDSASDWYERGTACMSSQQYEAAVQAFTAVIRIRPELRAYYNRGSSLMSLLRYPEASDDFTRVISQDPKTHGHSITEVFVR